jgi:hypothetical protein
MIYAIEMASGGMIYIPSFVKINTGVQAITWFCLSKFTSCNVGITDGKDFMKYAVEMDSDVRIYIHSFIKIGSGFVKMMATQTQS